MSHELHVHKDSIVSRSQGGLNACNRISLDSCKKGGRKEKLNHFYSRFFKSNGGIEFHIELMEHILVLILVSPCCPLCIQDKFRSKILHPSRTKTQPLVMIHGDKSTSTHIIFLLCNIDFDQIAQRN